MRIFAVLLLLTAWTPVQATLSIFACEPEWAALARELGGNKVDVYAATTALQDPHLIQARPSLIAKMRKADLAVCTGAELEIGWLPVLLTRANNPKVTAGMPGLFEASDHVDMLDIPTQVDRRQGDVHPYGNPHIQGDPHNITRIATALSQRLAQIDRPNAAYYDQRRADFIQRWQAAIRQWEEKAKILRGVRVISDHRGWNYLYHWLGIVEAATLEPKPGIPPSARHLQSLLASLQSDPPEMILQAAYTSDRPARWLSEQSNMPVVVLPFTVGEEVGVVNLFALFVVTIQRLLAGLNR